MLFRYAVTMRIARTFLLVAAIICLAASASLLFADGASGDHKGPVISLTDR